MSKIQDKLNDYFGNHWKRDPEGNKVDKATVNKYFGNNWKPNYKHYEYSGWALLDKVGCISCKYLYVSFSFFILNN